MAQWKDSKVLQAIGTTMKPKETSVAQHLGQQVINVTCPNNIVFYQIRMSGIDREYFSPFTVSTMQRLGTL
eukprot:15346490-Ditylum_brightwellii.AAC.1